MRAVTESKYTEEELKNLFLDIEKKTGRTDIKSTELEGIGLPSINYFNQKFGCWSNFLISLGREVKKREYRRKTDPKKFFFPNEWGHLLNVIMQEKHKIWFEILLHTGCRYNEAKNIQIKDIDFVREIVLIRKAKGGQGKQRTIGISTYLCNRLSNYVKQNNLGKLDDFKFSSIQYLDRALKRYAQKANINGYEDFSCHNLRKTLENWLVALNINILAIQAHMGHTLDVAHAHYVATTLIKEHDKVLIRSILGNLLQK